jgi:L-lactate dehydrogenase complex protein LldG
VVEKTPEPAVVVSAKDDILSRIRLALTDIRSDRESDYAYIPRNYDITGTQDAAARIALFIDRLHDYGAEVYECSEGSILPAVSAALSNRPFTSFVAGPEVPPDCLPTGFDFVRDEYMTYREIDRFQGVITGCFLAIAVTGTIVLRHAAGEPSRALTLIPDYHLCIVFTSQLVETVPEGIRQMAGMYASPLTTISGPSATSDIEMTRVKGVHGPRTLDVVLVHAG